MFRLKTMLGLIVLSRRRSNLRCRYQGFQIEDDSGDSGCVWDANRVWGVGLWYITIDGVHYFVSGGLTNKIKID